MVRAYNTLNGKKNMSGYYYPGTYYLYLENPELKGTGNVQDGIKLTWNTVKDAGYYNVYRRTDGTSYEMIAENITDTFYIDDQASPGNKYYYTVRAFANIGGTTFRSYFNASVSGYFIPVPVLTGITDTAKGYKLTWDSVDGADSYIVYRKAEGGKWNKAGEVKETSFAEGVRSSGTKYYYTVRAVKNSGGIYAISSYENPGLGYVHLDVPEILTVDTKAAGINVTWSKVKGAAVYKVYRKTGANGKYTVVGNVTKTGFVDRTGVSGKTYYYTVRAYLRHACAPERR